MWYAYNLRTDNNYIQHDQATCWYGDMLPASALFFPSLSSFPQPLSSVLAGLSIQLNVQHCGKKGGY